MEKHEESKWYIVQVVSNYEQKVKESLENRIFEDATSEIKEVFLPMEKTQTKTGKIKYKIIFPGYIFVKVVMTDESWYIIRNTQYVTGIVGSSGQRTKPTPIPETQINKILERIEKSELSGEEFDNNKVYQVDFVLNDWVQINTGNFANKEGKVLEINLEKQHVVVEIDFFGRLTPITLYIKDVQPKLI